MGKEREEGLQVDQAVKQSQTHKGSMSLRTEHRPLLSANIYEALLHVLPGASPG